MVDYIHTVCHIGPVEWNPGDNWHCQQCGLDIDFEEMEEANG